MAFGYDGSVRIKADLNHSNFDRGLVYMTKQVNTFGSTLKKIGGLVAVAFGTAALVNFGKESIKLASDIQEVQNVIDVTFGRGAAQIEEFAQSAVEAYGLSELAAKQYTGTMGAMLKSSGLTASAAQEMSMALTGLSGDIASFYNLSADLAFEKIRSGISGETEPLKQLGINMSVANLEAYALSKGITKSYNAMSQAEQVLLRYNYLLSVTTDAQGDFARTSGSFANQIRILQLNFDQLRIAVGNALIPIAQAVLPSINAIIAGLTKLARVFAQVTALLFGKSPEVKTTSGIAASAGAAADATDKLAESTAGAGSAAKQAEKDMKGVLASFDELNILASGAAGSVGGGGGGAGADIPDLEIPSYEAEIEDVDQLGEAFSSLGELFVKTLDEILAGMPAFKAALLEFADNFNAFNQKLYDAFTFPGVKERVEELGRELADAFNGLVNAIDWELWGRTLGAGLNLGLQFLTEFLHTFDWINLGTKLAEFINGLVYEVDWYDFGRLLWTQFKLGLETFAGFLLGLDMPELAKAASNIIKGFFDSMQESIANIDWAGIGRQIAEFLANIDWIGVIESVKAAILEAVQGLLDALIGFIENSPTEIISAIAIAIGLMFVGGKAKFAIEIMALFAFLKDKMRGIGETIAEAINKVDWPKIFEQVRSFVQDALSGALELLIGFVEALDWEKLGRDLWDMLAMIVEGVDWGGLIGKAFELLGAALGGGIQLLIGFLKEALDSAIEGVKNYFKEKTEEAGGNIVLGILKGIADGFLDIGSWIVDHIFKPFIDGFKNVFGIHSPSTVMEEQGAYIVEGLYNGISEKWSSIPEFFSEKVSELAQFLSSGWENIKKSTSEKWGEIKISLSDAWGVIKENANKTFGSLKDEVIKIWGNLKENTAQKWSEIKDGLVEKFAAINEDSSIGFSDIRDTIIGKIDETMTELLGKDWLSIGKDIVNGVMDGLSSIFGRLKDWAANVWSDITSAFSTSSAKSSFSGTRVSGGGGRISTYALPETATYSLPRLANGAVIPPNQQFAAILGDQRSGVNIEAPLSTIEQALENVLMRYGGIGGTTDVNVNFTGSLSELARILQPEIAVETRRRGTNLVGVRT